MNLQKGVLWEHLKKEKIHDEYRKEWFGHVFGLPWEVNKKVLTGGKNLIGELFYSFRLDC